MRILLTLVLALVSITSYSIDLLSSSVDVEVKSGNMEPKKVQYAEFTPSWFPSVAVSIMKVGPNDSLNYHMELDIVVDKGADSIIILVPVGDQIAELVLGGWKGKRSGINYINDIALDDQNYPYNSAAGLSFGERVKVQLYVTDGLISLDINGKEHSVIEHKNLTFGVNPQIRKQFQSSGEDFSADSGLVFIALKGSAKVYTWELNDL